jgi:hypothetical protein
MSNNNSNEYIIRLREQTREANSDSNLAIQSAPSISADVGSTF